MAMTKRFKKLPKDAKKAAFANMDARGGGKSKKVIVSKNKYPHIRHEAAKDMLYRSTKAFDGADAAGKKSMKGILAENVKSAKHSLKLSVKEGMRAMSSLGTGRHTDFLSIERAFRLKNK